MLTTKEAAVRLGLSPDGVRRLVTAGRLPVVRYVEGGRLRFREEDLDEFVRRGRSGGFADGPSVEAEIRRAWSYVDGEVVTSCPCCERKIRFKASPLTGSGWPFGLFRRTCAGCRTLWALAVVNGGPALFVNLSLPAQTARAAWR